jgi:phosphopantetheinyl transferase (holo-ACP synthase)
LISFVSIAIINNKNGVPEVFINGLRKDNIKISISHTNLQAIAFSILDNG